MGHLAEVDERERLLLTVVEAAAMLGVGRTKAYELIAGGELQVVHIGRAARVPLVAVHRYVEALLSPPPRTMRREKLADFAERWFDSRLVKGKPLAPMTKQGYLGLLARNIESTIGQYELARITPSIVRDWYSKVSKSSGRDQAAKSYRLLRAILNTAVDDELIVRNPCRLRGGGAERADERPMIDSALVFKLADSISAPLRALVIVAGFVGLRTGELLGLRRCDVDIENARLTVLVQAQQVVGLGRIVTGPKSEAGQRTVTLPKIVVEALEKHLANHGQPGEAGALFTGPRGEPITRALLSKEWQAARTAADAPEGLRIHDLRHHAATLTARMPGIHNEGADGPNRPRLTSRRAHLPTRDGTARP